ncbi:hypothetical protein BU17DRAFT_91690 [Hysterangium stoloniferum]|nr:hypothetical protein BU17DRAFT_91690 [Hysterangium stoloniferum]
MSPILGIGSHNNAMDDCTELGHTKSSTAVPAASTVGLPDLHGIIDYSTVEFLPPSYSLPDAQDSATVPPLPLTTPPRALFITPPTITLYFMSESDARINPLAGLELSDEQYARVLQSILNGELVIGGGEEGAVLGKRPLELGDMEEGGREEKRGRFQVVG